MRGETNPELAKSFEQFGTPNIDEDAATVAGAIGDEFAGPDDHAALDRLVAAAREGEGLREIVEAQAEEVWQQTTKALLYREALERIVRGEEEAPLGMSNPAAIARAALSEPIHEEPEK